MDDKPRPSPLFTHDQLPTTHHAKKLKSCHLAKLLHQQTTYGNLAGQNHATSQRHQSPANDPRRKSRQLVLVRNRVPHLLPCRLFTGSAAPSPPKRAKLQNCKAATLLNDPRTSSARPREKL